MFLHIPPVVPAFSPQRNAVVNGFNFKFYWLPRVTFLYLFQRASPLIWLSSLFFYLDTNGVYKPKVALMETFQIFCLPIYLNTFSIRTFLVFGLMRMNKSTAVSRTGVQEELLLLSDHYLKVTLPQGIRACSHHHHLSQSVNSELSFRLGNLLK